MTRTGASCCIAITAAMMVLLASPVSAQELTLDFGDDSSLAARGVQLLLLITVLSLVPGLAIMITSFPFLITVLSILRQGLGLQQSPPNMLMVTLALFLTYFVMEPTFSEVWETAIDPLVQGEIDAEAAVPLALGPFREFMASRIDPGTFEVLAELRPDVTDVVPVPETQLSVLIPSFLLSEIERAFQVGFLIFIPFLIIDLVVAAVLMSMGMMMVPPAIVSLPFKLAFFAVANGWTLVASALVRSYG